MRCQLTQQQHICVSGKKCPELWLELMTAGSGSKYAVHFAMLPPPYTHKLSYLVHFVTFGGLKKKTKYWAQDFLLLSSVLKRSNTNWHLCVFWGQTRAWNLGLKPTISNEKKKMAISIFIFDVESIQNRSNFLAPKCRQYCPITPMLPNNANNTQ